MNVYDFDNTIYDGESVLDLFFFYVKKDPYLIRYIPKVFYALAKYKAGKLTVEAPDDKFEAIMDEAVAIAAKLEPDWHIVR